MSKQSKIITSWVFAIVFCISIVAAGNTEDNYFYNQQGQNVTNVQMLIYRCVDNNEQCNNVYTPAWFNQNSGNNNYFLNIEFPGTQNPTDYARYVYANGYLPKEYVVPNDWGTGQHYTYVRTFRKASVCGTPIDSFSMTNTNYVNEPIVVNMHVSVDATTYSAFHDPNVPPFYVPNGYADYYSALTLVTFEVRDSEDNLVYNDSTTVNLYMDTSQEVIFSWTPTEFGDGYTAKIITTVIDDQCVASQDYEVSKIFNVLPERPTNEYYLLLNNLELDNISNIYVGQVLNFEYDKVSNEVDDSDSRIYRELPFTAYYEIYELGGIAPVLSAQEDISLQGSINWTTIFSDIDLDSLSAGMYTLFITGMPYDFTPGYTLANIDVTSVDFQIKEIPTYDVTFTVRDLETNDFIENAYVDVDGVNGYTNQNGVVVLDGFISGTYDYSVAHPEYSDVTGDVIIGGADVEVNVFMNKINIAPMINLEPIRTIVLMPTETQSFNFDDYISDSDDAKSSLVLSVHGDDPNVIDVEINGHTVTFTAVGNPGSYDSMTFTVTDPHGAFNNDYLVIYISQTECSDGIDNDGDSAIDMDDFSCSDPSDNDETNPVAQCQDSLDNDLDGLIDLNDPDCLNSQDNTEDNFNPGYTQCSDGIDNDGDGYVDLEDLGCEDIYDDDESDGPVACATNLDCGIGSSISSCDDLNYSLTTTEPTCFNPGTEQSYCQDLIDVISNQCNNICSDTLGCDYTQCSDGVDNDGDGYVDLSDSGCDDLFDDTELSEEDVTCFTDSDCGNSVTSYRCNELAYTFTNSTPVCLNAGTAQSNCAYTDVVYLIDTCDYICSDSLGCDYTQCSNGIDDDSDGLTDLNDPGCSSYSDDDESDGTSQCQDGLDNDFDNLIDMNDPDCTSPQDNSEDNFNPGYTQCSDGIDNDGDGYVDMNDPSCTSLQDDTEDNWDPGNSACSNGIDDDNDGLIDTNDPGCMNLQDNDEYNNWGLQIISTPVTWAYPDFKYEYDVNAVDPNGDLITYSLLQGPSGMTIIPTTGLIEWVPSQNQKGTYVVIVKASDGLLYALQQYNLYTDVPSVEKYPRRKAFISKIRMNNEVYEFLKAGDQLKIDTSFENWGVYDMDKATIRVTVENLGISRKIGPFDGPDAGDLMKRSAILEIPNDAKPGVYTLRMTLTTSDGNIKRTRHRDFRIE